MTMSRGKLLDLGALSDHTVRSIANRDAALWIGDGFDSDLDQRLLLHRLIGFPWRMVLCESTAGELASLLEAHAADTGLLASWRGFLWVMASDPERAELPNRSLPVFMLNGREGAPTAEEGADLPNNQRMRRRLNMLNELAKARSKEVVILSSGTIDPLQELFNLWDEGFRASISVVSSATEDRQRLESWLDRPNSPTAIGLHEQTLDDLVADIEHRISVEIPENRIIIRVKWGKEIFDDVDITDCESIEYPILDRYEILRSHQVKPLLREALPREDFGAFFDRSKHTWSPYAAGVPWHRSGQVFAELMKALNKVEARGSEANRILYVASESGAGGTTMARMLAFRSAVAGFPVLVARESFFRPELTEITTFLNRAQKAIGSYCRNADGKSELPFEPVNSPEIPWLLVFDVHHWEGHEAELRGFLRGMSLAGRPTVIVLVTGMRVSDQILESKEAKPVAKLTHELSQDEALRLGNHLNSYLRLYGREKSPQDWLSFWQNHRPQMDTAVASFWIALEFWLLGILRLGESIQSWLYGHFCTASLSKELRLLILEIAALSIERTPLPEGAMPNTPTERFPYSVLLDEARRNIPALALVRATTESQRQWALAHDLLGRYLVRAAFSDRRMLEDLDLTEAKDDVHLRLLLLRRIATRSALGEKDYLPLALEFAVRILKLDSSQSTQYIRYWREVLEILEHMPATLVKTNRSFNHHVAVSRRRVATQDEFDASLEEKKEQLERAIKQLEFALYSLESSRGDESNLNLFNSLSLAYQNLADLEIQLGGEVEYISDLRKKAKRAAQEAFREDPTNSYVLETVAKNLIQEGRDYTGQAITSSSEALGYIFQAAGLDQAELRQNPLTRLANEALKLLRTHATEEQIGLICDGGDPYGCLARTWLTLAKGIELFESYRFEDLPKANLQAGLAVLSEFSKKTNWMILRFRYDLVTVVGPMDFEEQVRILDELSGTPYRFPLQLKLEYAILLYQQGRSREANQKFYDLRRDITTQDTIVVVPIRLRWLLNAEKTRRRLCSAQVTDSVGTRSWAKVSELNSAQVPFRPEEFGHKRFSPGTKFRCTITFGAMGPFIRPPESESGSRISDAG
jgi:hypothetical protein